MSTKAFFPSLAGLEPTARTLHLYSKAVGVVPRAHAQPHPKWWHISLKLQPGGLATDEMPLPYGGTFRLIMDMQQHVVGLSTTHGPTRVFDMNSGLTATAFGDRIIAAVAGLGLEAEYDRERYMNDDPRVYDPVMAETFFAAVSNAAYVFEKHRASLTGDKGPVQFWPHGFDLSFEWFSTRVHTFKEHGQVKEYLSQLNLGFAPGDVNDGPYFYSNPWPFEEEHLVDKPLPAGALWHTEGWQGTIFPYAELVGDVQAGERLAAYAKAVYELSAPTLTA